MEKLEFAPSLPHFEIFCHVTSKSTVALRRQGMGSSTYILLFLIFTMEEWLPFVLLFEFINNGDNVSLTE